MSKEIQNNPTVEYTVDSDGITHGVIDNADVFLVVPAHSSDGEDSKNSAAHDSDTLSDNEATVAEGEQFYCHICGKSFFSYTTRALHELSHHTNNLPDGMRTLKDCPLAAVADVDTDATESADEVYHVLQTDQKTSKDGPPVDVAAMNITGLEKDQTSKDGTPADVVATDITGLEKEQTSKEGPPVDVAATDITGLEKDQTSKDGTPADVVATDITGLEKEQTSKEGPPVDVAATDITGLDKDQTSKHGTPADVVATNITYCGLEKEQTSKDGTPVDVAAMNITGLEKDQTSNDGPLEDVATNITYCGLEKEQTSKDGTPVDVAAMNITGLEKDQTSKDGTLEDVAATDSTHCGLEKDQTSKDGTLVDTATNIQFLGLEKDQTSKDSALADVDATNSADGLYCRACNSQFTSTFLYTLHMKHHEFQDSVQVSPGSRVERMTSIKEDPGMSGFEVADMTVNSNSRTDNPRDKTYVKSTNQTSPPEKQTTPCCHDNIVEVSKSSNSSNSEIGGKKSSMFNCKCCGKCFKSIDTFVKSHKKRSAGEGEGNNAGMFKCTECSCSFKSRGQLKMHTCRHVLPNKSNLAPIGTNNVLPNESNLAPIGTNKNSRPFIVFECYVCGNTFHSHKDLNVHKKGHFQEEPALTSIEVCDDIQTRSQTGGRAALEAVKLGTPILLQHSQTTKMADIDARLVQDKTTKMADKDAELLQDKITKMAGKGVELFQDKVTKMTDKDAEFSQHAGKTKMADIDTKLLQDKKCKTEGEDNKLLQQEKRTKMSTKDTVLLHDGKITKTARKNASLLQVKLTKLSDKDVKFIQNRSTKMADKDAVILQEDGGSNKVDNKLKHSDDTDAHAGSSVAGFDPRGYCLINETQFLVGLHKKDDKEQHRCRLCQRVFTTRVGLNVHMLSHSDEKPFVCPICGERFVLGVHLHVHKRKHTAICAKPRVHSKGGGDRKNFKTNWENKPDIKDKIGTKKCFSFYHSSVNNILRCECGKSFANKSNLVRHRELHKTPGSRLFNSKKNSVDERVRNFICPLCKRTFISRSNLETHKIHIHRTKHRNTDQMKNRKTSTCSKKTEKLKNRKISKCSKNTNRLSSKDPRSFHKLECLCGKRFRDKWFMSRHTSVCKYLSSRGIKQYVTTQTSFSKTMTTTTTTTEAVSTAGVVEKRTFHKCGLCEKVVGNKKLYKVHVARHWNPESKLFISTVDPSLLKEQMSILDGGGTTCVFCDKRSLNTLFAVNHLKVHIGMKPFECGECGCRYNWKENLRRHMRVKHEQKCGLDTYRKRYTQLGKSIDSYKKSSPNQRCKTGSKHTKINHRKDFNVKIHICKVCKMRFSDSISLKVHSKKHNSLKPFKCLECGKLFKSMHGKKGHVLNFHGSLSSECKTVKPNDTKLLVANPVPTYDLEASRKSAPVSVASVRLPDDNAVEKLEESKPLLCVVCDKAFRFKRLLVRHMLAHTGELPWPCRLCDKRYTTFAHLARHMTVTHRDTYQKYTRDDHSQLVKLMED